MFVIDSNIYIRALRDAEFAPRLAEFEQAALPTLWVSAVVLFEVAAGAADERAEQRFTRRMLRPFRDRARLLIPGAQTWESAARIDRQLRRSRRHLDKLRSRSFMNDMLLAAQCREIGATLITANAADFALMDRAVGFRYVTEFPAV